MCCILLIQSINEQLGCLHVLPTVNNATMNMSAQVPIQDHTLLCIHTEVELLDPMVILFLIV